MARLEFSDSDRLKIGIKQVSRALSESPVKTVYIAKDAEPTLVEQILKLAEAHSVAVCYVESKSELGKACHIDVGAATAVVLK